jgi:hypothetical protein
LAKGTTVLSTGWFANSISPCCWQIRWTRLLAKKPSFANSLLRQQHGPKLLAKPTHASGGSPDLPTAWAKAVGKVIGKAENFFPFSFAVFWHLIHTSNPNISI